MPTSPQSGPDFKSAIQGTLVEGEELISFANGWLHSEDKPVGLFTLRQPHELFQWLYLALTTHNIRLGEWDTDRPHPFWGETRWDKSSIHAVALQTNVILLDQLVAFSSKSYTADEYFRYERPKVNLLRAKAEQMEFNLFKSEARTGIKNKDTFFRSYYIDGSLYTISELELRVANGEKIKVYSFFEEMAKLGKDIEFAIESQKKRGFDTASSSSELNAEKVNDDVVKKLQELAELKEKGLIDEEEFKAAKNKLLE